MWAKICMKLCSKGVGAMIRGCQKKVIWIRNTGCELFEEAYFIMSDTAEQKNMKDTDMVAQANRLIEASPFRSYWNSSSAPDLKKTKIKIPLKKRLRWFLCGSLLSASILLLVDFLMI